MDTLGQMLEKVRDYKMSPQEKRAQAISWVSGNIAIDRPEADLWQLTIDAAKAYDARNR